METELIARRDIREDGDRAAALRDQRDRSVCTFEDATYRTKALSYAHKRMPADLAAIKRRIADAKSELNELRAEVDRLYQRGAAAWAA